MYKRLADLNKNDTTSQEVEQAGRTDKIISQVFNYTSNPDRPGPPGFYGQNQYDDFLSKRVLLSNYSWLSTTPRGTIIRHTDDIFGSYLNGATTKGLIGKLNYQAWFKGKMKVTITLQGAPQAYGQRVFFAYPTPRFVYDTAATVTTAAGMVRAKSLPHVVMDPSKSCVCEFEIPCCTPEGVWYENDKHSWQLSSVVYNELGSGTDAPVDEINGSIYFSFTDLEPGPMTLLAQGDDFLIEAPVNLHLYDFVSCSEPIIEEEEAKGPLSGPASAISKAADALTEVPVIGPYMTITSAVAGTASRFLKWFGFSRPYATNPSQVVTNKTTTTYGAFNTTNFVTPLATDGANAISASPLYFGGGEMEDMDIAHICSMPSLIDQLAISTNTSIGVLGTTSVNPCIVKSDGPNIELSNLAYMALPFKYWHGEITYTFEVVCSAFHRCIIGVAWSPRGIPTDWARNVQAVRSEIINVCGNTTFQYTVPWQQINPFANIRGINSTEQADCNGIIAVHLLSPLESNGSTDVIRINVYAHSDKMDFMVPSNDVIQNITFATEDITALAYFQDYEVIRPQMSDESEFVECSGCEMISEPVLDKFGKDAEKDIFLRFGGEDVATSTKKVASKMSLANNLTGALSFHDVAHEGNVFDYEIAFSSATTWRHSGSAPQARNSFFDYYGAGYMGTRGSVNMSMVPLRGSMTNTGINFFWLTLNSTDLAKPSVSDAHPFGRNLAIGYPEIHPTNDVSVPHYVNGYFRPSATRIARNLPSAAFGHEGLNGEFFMLKGMGDDGVYVKYLGPPMLA